MKASHHRHLPASWLYVEFTLTRLFARLNTGDRVVLGVTASFVAAIPVLFGVQLGRVVTQLPSHFSGLAIGLFACFVVSFLVTATMISVRGHRYFAFLPEARAQKITRIALEFVASCLISFVVIAVVIAFLPKLHTAMAVASALVCALFGHGIVHGIQLCLPTAPLQTTSIQTLSGMTRRNGVASILARPNIKRLPSSSSRFMRKANDNPLLWVFVILTMLASGGAAMAWKSLLLGLSTLSTLIFMLQCALVEPRVGNGPAIGAHSATLPIKRARQDLIALAFPHFGCLIIAPALIVMGQNATHAAIAMSQFLITLWILWLWLVMGALPTEDAWRTYPLGTVLAIISYQIFPPVLPVLFFIGTLILTRDLVRLSLKGPASWPR